MNKKTVQAIRKSLMVFFLLLCSVRTEMKVYASDEQEYITISVDATDENGGLLYALDTDDESAFTSSNEFSVPAGTSHTIYVKDAAGNISSQEFNSSESYMQVGTQSEETDTRTVNIDVTLNDPSDYPEYRYSTSISDPAEAGQGTLYEKVTTDASDQNAERIFYTVTTKEGEVFYMVIDQGQSNNNVYLLDQVSISDLKSLAVDDSGVVQTESSSSLLGALSSTEENTNNDNLVKTTDASTASDKSSRMTRNLIILLIIAVFGGGYYYYKNVYKNKRDEQMDLIDALNKDDFIAENEDSEEVNFELEENYQDQIMQQLINDEYDDGSNILENNFDENIGVEENISQITSIEKKEEEEEEEEEDDEFEEEE